MKYLNEYLKSDANYTPLLTRPIDLKPYEGIVSIKARANSANKLNAELLISVHASSSTLAESAGIECYPKVPKTPQHEESILLARHIVNEIEDMQPDIKGIDGIRYRYYNSEAFAESNDTNPDNDDTYYGIVRIPNCPAVLVELCSVDTQSDVEKFDSDKKWKKAAVRFYYVICNYFSTSPIFDKDGLYICNSSQPVINTGLNNLAIGATYKIRNKLTGRMLNVYGAKISQTNNVVQWSDDASVEQQWVLQNTKICICFIPSALPALC